MIRRRVATRRRATVTQLSAGEIATITVMVTRLPDQRGIDSADGARAAAIAACSFCLAKSIWAFAAASARTSNADGDSPLNAASVNLRKRVASAETANYRTAGAS
jgi:hypothetical protein